MSQIKIAISFKQVPLSVLADVGRAFSHILVSGADAEGKTFSDTIDGVTHTATQFDAVSVGKFEGKVQSIDTEGNLIEESELTFEFDVQDGPAPVEKTFPVATGVSVTQLA